MKKAIIDVSGNNCSAPVINTAFSFKPFIDSLRKRANEEKTAKKQFFDIVLQEFAKADLENKELTENNLHAYEHLLELVYACQSPTMSGADEVIWGLCKPMQPLIVYSTDTLHDLMIGLVEKDKQKPVTKSIEDYTNERLRVIYGFILKRLYHFESVLRKELYHIHTDPGTAAERYLEASINTDFIEIISLRELPVIKFRQLKEYISENMGFEMLKSLLPLDMFRFRGLAMITVTDVTGRQAVENIKKIRLTRTPGNEETTYRTVTRSLKMLLCNDKIEFDFFPFVRVNDKFVFGYEKGGTGVLYNVWGEKTLSPEEFQQRAHSYSIDPQSFYSRDIRQEDLTQYSFLASFITQNVTSLALLPLFRNQTVVGIVAIHTWGEDVFEVGTMAMLEPAIQPIALLMQVYIDEFNLEIEKIVKEKFTSIQPSVQWKFNEAAWHYLRAKKKNLPIMETEPVHFSHVYPLYGAVDIRNSTIERNQAIKHDIDHRLGLLAETLSALRAIHKSSLLEQMNFSCKTWQKVTEQDQLTTTEENNLGVFLNNEAGKYLDHLAGAEPRTEEIIQTYFNTVRDAVSREQALETSMQLLNNAINNYLEAEQQELQLSYPCYFEKFRTDGVEYDIYIGQSIAPDKPFSHFHLRNVRLWQLSSMAAIARLTHSLLPGMPVELRTTQLIFVHNNTIDISFRTDERKFDVEGAYNIRYQMIKKRIDKVRIRNSQERLTQPDMIALVYFNKKDIEDYLPYIQYLQETEILESEYENLDLEDLQGLTGLKAIRLGVKLLH
ncbi:GAF domain-containing protein [Dyadobacter bucti]|uniref:GAF domain-containing protein n=1 Tax=Dyadobacter bucti TaxID=2572203 RepID=UPI003F719BE4